MHDVRLLPAAGLSWLSLLIFLHTASWIVLSATLACCVVAALCWPRFVWATFTLLAVSAVLAGLSWRLASLESVPWQEWIESGESARLEAVLVADPKVVSSYQDRRLMRVRITRITVGDRSYSVPAQASGFIEAGDQLPVMGDRLVMTARLTEAHSVRDVAQLSVQAFEVQRPLSRWWDAAEGVRQGIRAANIRGDNQGAALIPALVMGDDSQLDELTRHDFRRTGLTHVLAVSGANLTIVLAVVLGLLRIVGQRRLLLAAGLFVTLAFVLIARPEPSVQRAAVMGVVAVMGLGRSKSSAGFRALSWAVLGLLIVDPWQALDYGFALSVLATGGIVGLAEPLASRFEHWAPRWFALSLAVPLAAQLVCLPVIAMLTDEVSLVSLAANMAAAAAVAPATICGLVAGLVYLLWPPLSVPFAGVGWLSATWIVLVGRYAADTAGASMPWALNPWWLAPLAGLLGFAVLRWGSSGRIMLAAAAISAIVIVQPFPSDWPSKNTALIACDVGQGDAFIIPLEKRSAIVIDVGENPADINRCLRDIKVRTISLLAFTHAHADHTDGWAGAVRGRTVGAVLVGSSGGPSAGPRAQCAKSGDRFTIDKVSIEVLWPRTCEPKSDPNNESLVLRIEAGEFSMLFTGDIGAEVARRIAGDIEPVDVLKIPHHGSADMWPELFDIAQAPLAIIGVGADNRHGHPRAEVLDALSERGITVWRTDEDGTFGVIRDGPVLRKKLR